MSSHTDTSPPAGAETELDLAVEGMTCGSCAARVEKVLGHQDGVHTASVNFATGKAHVIFDSDVVDLDALSAAVDKIGYGLTAPRQADAHADRRPPSRPTGSDESCSPGRSDWWSSACL